MLHGGWIALALLVPVIVSDTYHLNIVINIGVASVLGLGVRLVMLSGQYPFGQAGMMAIGGYVSAILVSKQGLNFWVTLPLAGIAAGLFALIVGYPALRVKGIQFALLTLALGGAIRQGIIMSPDLTGSLAGLFQIPVPNPINIAGLSIRFGSSESFYYLALGLLLLTLGVMASIDRSRLGGLYQGMSESDDLAQSVGISVLKYRVMAFVLASVFAGLAGSFTAHFNRLVHPDFFGLFQSIFFVAYVIVGGVRSILGPILGAALLILAVEFLRPLQSYQGVANAGMMLIVILFIPGGVGELARRHRGTSAGHALRGRGARNTGRGGEGVILLKLEALSKDFGGVAALADVSFDVHEGEILGLIGPNGAGKTTLFNVVSGRMPPSAGRLTFDGEDLTGSKLHQTAARGLVRTFQHSEVFHEMTVLENVMVAHHLQADTGLWSAIFQPRRISREAAKVRSSSEAILTFLDLSAVAEELAGNLSHGHQRALGIAVAPERQAASADARRASDGHEPAGDITHGVHHREDAQPRYHRCTRRTQHACRHGGL